MEHVKCENIGGLSACSSDTREGAREAKVSNPKIVYRELFEITPEQDGSVTGELVDMKEEDVTHMSALKNDPYSKPGLSYIALISMAIQSSDEKRMLLSEIYQWITDNFPYYKSQDRSWRNSIRHNLSLNECFVKSGRSENGKGNYWSIHVANMDDFDQGDYRRRHARSRVRKCEEEVRKLNNVLSDEPVRQVVVEPNNCISSSELSSLCDTLGSGGYVPMTCTIVPTSVLISTFGADAILTKEEQLQRFRQPPHQSVMTQSTNFNSVSAMPISSASATLFSTGHFSSMLSSDYTFPSLLPLSSTENANM